MIRYGRGANHAVTEEAFERFSSSTAPRSLCPERVFRLPEIRNLHRSLGSSPSAILSGGTRGRRGQSFRRRWRRR